MLRRSTDTCNEKTLEVIKGRDGRDGRDGLPGPKGMTGPTGPKGNTGPPGPEGKVAGGVVYIRWGSDICPDNGAQLVYTGKAAGSHYTHKGGGGNPQCLPLDPEYFQHCQWSTKPCLHLWSRVRANKLISTKLG